MATIETVDIQGGTIYGITFTIQVAIFNPSNLKLTLGDLTLQLVRDSATLGTATMLNLVVNMGNNTVQTTSNFQSLMADSCGLLGKPESDTQIQIQKASGHRHGLGRRTGLWDRSGRSESEGGLRGNFIYLHQEYYLYCHKQVQIFTLCTSSLQQDQSPKDLKKRKHIADSADKPAQKLQQTDGPPYVATESIAEEHAEQILHVLEVHVILLTAGPLSCYSEDRSPSSITYLCPPPRPTAPPAAQQQRFCDTALLLLDQASVHPLKLNVKSLLPIEPAEVKAHCGDPIVCPWVKWPGHFTHGKTKGSPQWVQMKAQECGGRKRIGIAGWVYVSAAVPAYSGSGGRIDAADGEHQRESWSSAELLMKHETFALSTCGTRSDDPNAWRGTCTPARAPSSSRRAALTSTITTAPSSRLPLTAPPGDETQPEFWELRTNSSTRVSCATPSTTLSSTTPRFDRSRGDPEALSALRRLPLSLPTLGESVRSCSTGWLHDQRRWRCWPQNLGTHHATARASVTLQTHLPKVRPACSSRRWKPRGGRLRTIFFASAPIPVLPPLPPTHSSPPRPLSAYRSRQHTAFPPALHPSSALPILSLTFPPPTSHPHIYVANPFPPQIFCGRAQWTKIATLVADANAGFEMHDTRNCSGGGVGMHTKMILGTLLPLPVPAPESDPEATESDTESGPEPESSSDVEIIDSKVDEEERGQLHAWLAWGTLSESGFQPVLTLGVVMRLDTEQAMEGAVTWERPAKRYGRGDVPWIQAESPFFQ
ncbi:hypothetical protein K438DRAFT_1787226 [Mycena galopus ATCC 62051]|nr:hypothetical protein K438DRAFT_1787226 [Mycena galopus ATCC 62051]